MSETKVNIPPDYNAFFRLAKDQVNQLIRLSRSKEQVEQLIMVANEEVLPDVELLVHTFSGLPIVAEMLDYGQRLHLRQEGFTQPMLCGGCEEVVMKEGPRVMFSRGDQS